MAVRGLVRGWVCGLVLSAALVGGACAQDSVEALRRGFLNPPDEARPMVRWWWFGPAVTKPEIARELAQMKADGIGGAELAFVYPEELDDAARGMKNLGFLSPEMLSAVTFAKDEGKRLGLRIDVTLCSGWPYGGPATSLAEAATRLKVVEVAVAAGSTKVEAPKLEEGESVISAVVAKGALTPAPARRGPGADVEMKRGWDASTAVALSAGGDVSASDAGRVAVFFVQSHTKQQVKRAAVGAEGYVLDPFSRTAVATHLKAVGEPLVKAFGAAPPYAIFSDSLEAYGADWTPRLAEEFKKRRGYDLVPHLPELVAGGTPEAAKVRHDWGVTLTELVNENYLTQINDWAKAHGTRFRSQTYGEPAVSFSSQRLASLPEGEGPQWRAFSTLRWATSANHVFGNNVTSGETFTWLHSPVFRATPLDMKAEADIDFIMGENQLIFHGWPYSPPDTDIKPGWSLYAAGNFNDNNPWHPVMPAVTKYITRMSWLLRQGVPANQVAVLLPTDDAWAGFSPGKVTVTGAMQQMVPKALMSMILSGGYNVDYIDADAIQSVGLGAHQVLVLPPTDRIPVGALQKIAAWVAKGGKVIAVGKLPSMDAGGRALPDGATKMMALVPSENELRKALLSGAEPDLRLIDEDPATRNRIGFIRRKMDKADVYVVVNTSPEPVYTAVSFATKFHGAKTWDADGGSVEQSSSQGESLQLAPYESRVFVFADGLPMQSSPCTPNAALADMTHDWRVRFASSGKEEGETTLTDWTSDPATLHYSGEAVYTRDVSVATVPKARVFLEIEGGTSLPGAPNSAPEHAPLGANGLPDPLVTRTGPGMHAYFEAPVREAALVFINGQEAGALWHPPYRLEVGKLLKAGVNHVEIRVYNTALNAWSALEPHDFGPLKAQYGDRFQMQDLDKVKPVPSGLVGTVTLVTESL